MAYSRENNIRWFNNVMAIWTAFNGEMVSKGEPIWTASTLPVKGTWNRIVFGEKNFVASSSFGETAIVYSEDRGQTWKRAAIPDYAQSVELLSSCGESLVCVMEKYDDEKERYVWGVFYSLDDGKTWKESVVSGSTWFGHVFGPFCCGDGVVLGIKSHKIIRSMDNGKTFADVESDTYASSIAYGNGRFMTAGYGKTYYSTDGGITWVSLPDIPWDTPFTSSLQENLIAYAGNGRFVYISGEYALYSDGEGWEEASVPPDYENSAAAAYGGYGILCPGETELLYFEKAGHYLYKSSDGGETWEMIAKTSFDILSITYGDGTFVAVGGGYPDGIGCLVIREGSSAVKYEAIPTNGWIAGTQWAAVAYGDRRFAATSYGGEDVKDDPYRASNRAAYRDTT